MLNNLEAEIARKRIDKKLIATEIGKSCSTLTSKIYGKFPFTYDEALKIQEVFFPEYEIKYLFKRYS